MRPICDFVSSYIASGASRFHMPGHKGVSVLGPEAYDITEIDGADVLSSASGIIGKSEDLTSEFFGTGHTFYSTEGSTLAIKAMLALATSGKKNPTVLADRCAHKAFILSAALIGFDVEWLYSDVPSHLCVTRVTPESVRAALIKNPDVSVVYLTSPDYLGNIADISAIAEIAHEHGALLLVDNAHGAYLKLLTPSRHPIDLGADMCADSAHKTLPVLTGGAYLHISKNAPSRLISEARTKMSIFASTSPSYLILQSLDIMQERLNSGYTSELSLCVRQTNELKANIAKLGYIPEDTEPCKIVINAKKYGYTGTALAEALRRESVECEFADSDYLVLMTSPALDASDYKRVLSALSTLQRLQEIPPSSVPAPRTEKILSVREAIFAKSRRVSVTEAIGKICAAPTVSCPPAVPIAVSGELITEDVARAFLSYGITDVLVVDE